MSLQPRPPQVGQENRLAPLVLESPVRERLRIRRHPYPRTRPLGRTEFDAVRARNRSAPSEEAWNRWRARAALDLHTGRHSSPGPLNAAHLGHHNATHLGHQVATEPGNGLRVTRHEPLKREDLWAGGVGPGDRAVKKPHEQCSICSRVKSHPVSYMCGHSHCYVCIRLRLETRWDCPVCRTTMYCAPWHAAEEAAETGKMR
ncbi:hypothetical protein C8F04DRAFT_1176852 [Mycena alexandri]|uniref:RING-type domain-containing protein n=1 Tax=Mycena alexandri TaxID=1745969 RepID=A0AAD6T8G7_9AGAR|nr:hypothetical protein C8F04DRAFT_1176852 [Mycena alexandri]